MYIFIFIYICFADAVKKLSFGNFQTLFSIYFQDSSIFFQVTSKIRHFLPRYFQDQTFSSKLLPRSGIFFQVTFKIRHFLPSYFQDQILSCKILQDQTFSCKILQDQTLSSKILQDTCKNNALFSKILEVKSDRFLQEMYGSSTGVVLANLMRPNDHSGCFCFLFFGSPVVFCSHVIGSVTFSVSCTCLTPHSSFGIV